MRTKPCLTAADAHKMMAACKAEAEKNKWKVSIVIVDDAGIPLLLERLDGAGTTTPEVALGKAWTAAAYRAPSAAQGEKAQKLVAFAGAISAATGGRYTPQIGGLPIERDGEVIGAMGASGALGEQDEAVVRAALERAG